MDARRVAGRQVNHEDDTPPAMNSIPGSLDFSVDRIRFKVGRDRPDKTDQEGVVLLKGWQFVERELEIFRSVGVRRMLEVGIAHGGSAALWMSLLPLERYVGIDIREIDIRFPSEVLQHPRWPVVRLHGGVSQDDGEAIKGILRDELDGPLDAVVDDASHLYEPSLATFETCFPLLRPGGVYIIEDWAWAHNAGPWDDPGHPWHGRKGLSNLILRLIIISGRRTDIVERATVRRGVAAFWRGHAKLDDTFRLESLLDSRSSSLGLI